MQEWNWVNLLKQGRVVAFFQPIFSVSSKTIYGYEVLGRLAIENNKYLSLGKFFTDNRISHSQRRELDREIQRKALEFFARHAPKNTKLFLNFSPNRMLEYAESSQDELLFLLQSLREFGVSPERIIIEITEEPFEGSLESLKSILEEYKVRGFVFAIDDVGSNSSNLDRIGTLEPEIIKIDMRLLKESTVSRNYYEINLNLSQLAQSLGIYLLYEGIETQEELNISLNFGAAYLQGFFFQEAMPCFYECNEFSEKINYHVSQAIQSKIENIRKKIQWEKNIESRLDQFNVENHFEPNGYIRDYQTIFQIDPHIKRIYITDMEGNQLSPNYTMTREQKINIETHAIGKNWSWRPYFSHHIYESIKNENSWIISSIYKDLSDGNLTRTLSKNIHKNKIVFIDVIYEE